MKVKKTIFKPLAGIEPHLRLISLFRDEHTKKALTLFCLNAIPFLDTRENTNLQWSNLHQVLHSSTCLSYQSLFKWQALVQLGYRPFMSLFHCLRYFLITIVQPIFKGFKCILNTFIYNSTKMNKNWVNMTSLKWVSILKIMQNTLRLQVAKSFTSQIANDSNIYLWFLQCFGWTWLAQLERSLPSNHKVLSSIPGSAKFWTDLCDFLSRLS